MDDDALGEDFEMEIECELDEDPNDKKKKTRKKRSTGGCICNCCWCIICLTFIISLLIGGASLTLVGMGLVDSNDFDPSDVFGSMQRIQGSIRDITSGIKKQKASVEPIPGSSGWLQAVKAPGATGKMTDLQASNDGLAPPSEDDAEFFDEDAGGLKENVNIVLKDHQLSKVMCHSSCGQGGICESHEESSMTICLCKDGWSGEWCDKDDEDDSVDDKESDTTEPDEENDHDTMRTKVNQ